MNHSRTRSDSLYTSLFNQQTSQQRQREKEKKNVMFKYIQMNVKVDERHASMKIARSADEMKREKFARVWNFDDGKKRKNFL